MKVVEVKGNKTERGYLWLEKHGTKSSNTYPLQKSLPFHKVKLYYVFKVILIADYKYFNTTKIFKKLKVLEAHRIFEM